MRSPAQSHPAVLLAGALFWAIITMSQCPSLCKMAIAGTAVGRVAGHCRLSPCLLRANNGAADDTTMQPALRPIIRTLGLVALKTPFEALGAWRLAFAR